MEFRRTKLRKYLLSLECGTRYPKHQIAFEHGVYAMQIARDGPQRIRTKLLAYNLTRMTIGGAVKQSSTLPRTISFVSTYQYVLSNWGVAFFSASSSDELIHRLLRGISQCGVGNIPGRFERLCVKRRMDQYKLMMEPRYSLRKKLGKGDNSFERNNL